MFTQKISDRLQKKNQSHLMSDNKFHSFCLNVGDKSGFWLGAFGVLGEYLQNVRDFVLKHTNTKSKFNTKITLNKLLHTSELTPKILLKSLTTISL